MIKVLVHPLLIFCSVVLLSACANTGKLTNKLVKSTSSNFIELQDDIFYEQSRGIGVLWKEGASKGIYKPEFENEAGIFYKGPPKCIFQYMEGNLMGTFDGGIWIPKDTKNQNPRLYYYFDYNPNTRRVGGAIITGILEASKGDITFMPEIKDNAFISKIELNE